MTYFFLPMIWEKVYPTSFCKNLGHPPFMWCKTESSQHKIQVGLQLCSEQDTLADSWSWSNVMTSKKHLSRKYLGTYQQRSVFDLQEQVSSSPEISIYFVPTNLHGLDSCLSVRTFAAINPCRCPHLKCQPLVNTPKHIGCHQKLNLSFSEKMVLKHRCHHTS